MTDRDSFLREVDEAVRQDRYQQLWDKYGVYALGLAVLVVAGVGGFKGWTYWQEQRAQEAGAKFTQALTMEDGADAAKAREMLTALAEQRAARLPRAGPFSARRGRGQGRRNRQGRRRIRCAGNRSERRSDFARATPRCKPRR